MKILITFILLFVTQFGWAQAVLSSKEEVTKHADKTINDVNINLCLNYTLKIKLNTP